MFIVYAQKCGSKQIHNLAPFSTSLPTSAEECKKFKIIPPHFEIENVTQNRRFLSTDVQFRVNAQAVQILTSNKSADNFQITVVMI